MSARLLWVCGLGFLCGVFLRSVMPLGIPFALFLGFTAMALAVILYSLGQKTQGIVCVVVLLSAALGVWRMDSAILQNDAQLDSEIGKHISLEGVVTAEPDDRGNSVRVTVRGETLASSSVPLHAAVLAVVDAFAHVSYGEHVRVSGELQLPEKFDTSGGRQFNYPAYLAKDGIGYMLARAHIERHSGFEGNYFTASAILIKQLFVRGLQNALPEPQSGLAAGITVGDKRALGKNITQEFITTSLVHVMVLSGYNITVVIDALNRVLVFFPRIIGFGAGAFVALFFVVMTGGAASSMRAALMALIAISGKWSNRMYRADRALLVVATAMVVWNPYTLVFDPGYQLSVLATAGLIFLSPVVSKYVGFIPAHFGIQEIAISTISAQVAVIPLLLYQNGIFSIVALPANLLVLAVVPLAMLASALASIGGLFLGPLAVIIGLPANALLTYMLFVVHLFASLPFASVAIQAFSAWWLVPAYGIIGWFVWAHTKTAAGNAAV